MTITLRTIVPEQDYPDLIGVLNTVWDDAPVTAETLHGWDARTPPEQITHRRVAVTSADKIVGYAEAMYQPWKPLGHFWLWVAVDPEWRHQGIGSTLYDTVLQLSQADGATTLLSTAYEHHPEGLHFAERGDSRIERREFDSTLDLKSFDECRFAGVIEACEAGGIRFTSIAEIGDTPESRHQLYAINRATSLDIPGSDGTFPSFEESTNWIFQASWFRAGGQLLALDGERWVGYSGVGYYEETNSMYNFMTGVDKAYRGRKIALALKLLAIRFAKANGADYIRTNNDAENAPMLAINRKLGYQPLLSVYQVTNQLVKRE